MNDIEIEFDMDCLLKIRRAIFRARANEQYSLVRNQKKTATATNETTGSWYMSYAKWISSKTVDVWKTTPTIDSNTAIVSTASSIAPLNENDKKLQEQVSTFIAQSLEDEDLSQRRRDALYLRLKFVLKSVQVDLLAVADVLFEFCLNNVSVLTELRPRHQSILVYLRLEDLNIRDRIRTDAFSTIVCPKQRAQETSGTTQRAPIFELSFEKNPPAQQPNIKRLSFSIGVRSRGLCLVCCPLSVERLRNFFTAAFDPPSSIPTSSSTDSIFRHWTQLKDRTTKQLKSAFEQIFSTNVTTENTKLISSQVKHIKQGRRRQAKKFDIYLDICAPQMIIPQSSRRALIVDFGWLTLINDEYRKSCPLKNCDMHRGGLVTPSAFTDFFQQRSYFFNEQHVSPLPSTTTADEDDEFLTPDSSPLAMDGTFETETVNYPINVITTDRTTSPTIMDDGNLLYTSFSLCLCDMQLGYLTYSNNVPADGLSMIIEKFGVCFLVQHRTVHSFDPLWPLIKVSGTIPKIIVHLDPQRIETVCGAIDNWGSFLDNLTPPVASISEPTISTTTTEQSDISENQQSSARLAVGFRINEISIQLSDDLRALCEIRIQNIDLTLMNSMHSNILALSVHTLMIVDALQHEGKDYELLLTSNRALDINTQTGTLYENSPESGLSSPTYSIQRLSPMRDDDEYLIRINVQSSTNVQTNEHCLNMDIHVNKLHFVFNPETLCILTNFGVDTIHRMMNSRRRESIVTLSPIERHRTISNNEPENNPTKTKKSTRFQINSEFQELSVLFTNVVPMMSTGKRQFGSKLEKVAAARIRCASLIISLEPSTLIEAEICALQIFNLLRDPQQRVSDAHNEQSSAIVDLGTEDEEMIRKETDHEETLPSKAFHLLYTSKKTDENNQIEDLAIEMGSVCYVHSPKILYKIEKILNYIAQNSHSSTALEVERMKQNMLKQGTMLLNQFVHPTESVLQTEQSFRRFNLNLFLATPILIFRPKSSTNDRLVFHLGHIRVENDCHQSSNYEIKIDRLHLFSIDLEHETRHGQGTSLVRIYKYPHLPSPILDNISIRLDLQLADGSTTIDSKLVSSVQMFLGKHQITLLQNIIGSLTYNDADHADALIHTIPDDELISLFDEELLVDTVDPSTNSQFNTFAIHFQLPELIIIFQADLDLKPTKVCEAIFGQFQMSIEQRHPFCKTIALRLDSLQINDHLINADECLFSTRCRRSRSNTYRGDHLISSSFPTEKQQLHVDHPSNSVPAYMITNDSSTWTLTERRKTSSPPPPPAFIELNIRLMDKRHEQFDRFNLLADAQFGEVDIKFVISTWVMLFDIIGLIGGGTPPVPTTIDLRENKEDDSMQISIHIDAVSCLLRDDDVPPIRISLQRFDCQIQTYLTLEKGSKSMIVDGKLGFVSIRDLSPFGQLYEERFCTSGTNALIFIYTKEEDLIQIPSANFPARLQLYLRMTSVQYIHTQRFLMDLIHFFDRFQNNQDCYNRIRSAAAGQIISCSAGRSTGIELDIEAESPILILPEYALNKPVIILHLGNIIIKNSFLIDNQPGTLSALMNQTNNNFNNNNNQHSACLLDVISVQFKDTLLYSAFYCSLETSDISVRFSNFAFSCARNDLSSMLRERCYLNIQIERNLDSSLNHASPTYKVKADLSSIDILIDTHQYSLVRGILAYNIGEQLEQPTRPAMMIDDPLCVSTVLTGDVYVDMVFIIQMDNVGFEIFVPDVHSNGNKRHSLAYCAFIKSHFSFDKYSNGNQVLDLTCASIKLIDTRVNNENQFRDILVSASSMSTSTSGMQLEIHLLSTKIDDKYTIVLNHTRVLFIVDWLLKLNDFLHSFKQIPLQSPTITTVVNPPPTTVKSFELRLNFNQSELVLVQTTNNRQSNALVLSGIMILTYRESIQHRPLECSLFSITLFSCQMNDIEATAVSIIEPIKFTFNVHTSSKDKKKQVTTTPIDDKRTFELNLPALRIRLSYSDVKLMLYMFESISKQIHNAQARDLLPNYVTSPPPPKRALLDNAQSTSFFTEFLPETSQTDFRIRSAIAPSGIAQKRKASFDTDLLSMPNDSSTSASSSFLNIQTIKFGCEQISLCLIDDCHDANIPLLNINLAAIQVHSIDDLTQRFQRADFQLNIDYYNRLLSGYEPLIEVWPLQMTLKTSLLASSLLICSNHILNINYTKTMYQLYDLVKNNWLADYYSSTNISKETMYFRRPKPFEPYCLKNLVGQRIKFRTWLSSQQRFDLYEHIVEYKETKSFTFPSESSTKKQRSMPTLPTSSYSDRRLFIAVEGWEWLQPISIDRVGTFFRLAVPSGDRLQKPVLVFIDVAMTDSSMRSITVRSALEMRNQLLTTIDVRLKCGSNSLHDFRLEPNETRSLPLQFCSTLKQFQVRPADFGLNFCGEPINWIEIANERPPRKPKPVDNSPDENVQANTSALQRQRDINSTDRQSFFRTCSMDGNEALYFVCLQSKRTRLLAYKDNVLSAYQLSILSPLIIRNLLPCDLSFQFHPHPQKIRLNAYKSHREHALNIGQSIDILFATDLYRMAKPLNVPSINDLKLMRYHHQRIAFYDSIQRMLLVDVTIVCVIRHRLKISLSVPYVLLNKSGIPLIFKQESSTSEAAGQTHEHELARNREPLLFSFSDPEAAFACVMRVGSGLHKNDDGRPLWSQRFSLERGSSYRQLYVRSPHGSPDWIYYIGIDVRQGKGRSRRTNFIFLSTRYMISNQCSYDLSIAQRHIVRAMLQTGDHSDMEQNCLHVLKHSNVAYHWPRSDLDQLLCVRVINNRQYRHVYWSGGFLIDRVNAFHINLRYDNNQCLILRVQVIERGGTYFVVFMDSNQMPAPLRVQNLSDVPIQFYQSETREELTYLRAFIQPHQSIDYAWDEPTLKHTITCSIVGGTKETYDLYKLGYGENLCYENHICLALQATFDDEEKERKEKTPVNDPVKRSLVKSKTIGDVRSSYRQLVIDYVQGRLILAQREENKRSQLWRMTSNGLLVHTGSSSPRDWSNKHETADDIRQASVLDIEEYSGNTALNIINSQTRFTQLTVRRYDPKRSLTQTWRFLDNGYLCMGQTPMCVQVFGELKENSNVVLGPRVFDQQGTILPPQPTMYIRPHRRLKGSGLLSVRTYADGPTRVLEIANVKPSHLADSASSESLTKTTNTTPSTVYRLDLRLEAGIGISVVSSVGRESEELVYMILNDIRLEYKDEENEQSVEGTIGTIIVSNQLLTTTTPCLLYATYVEDASIQSAVRLEASLQKPSANYKQLHILRYLRIGLNSITIQIDEILLWKLIEFFGMDFSSSNDGNDQTFDLDEGEYDTQRLLSLLTSTQATRIYFNELSISSIDLNLSVFCGHSRSLPAHLLNIKRRAPFPLVRFENAQIDLKSYEQIHIFNTFDFFLLALTTNYVDELKRQAFKVLGSVDFLGNPLGLFNDVTDGFASLVDHGSVTGLVKNVAHGVADSTSKFTGTLSYGLGKLALDDEHDDMREAIANNYRGSSIGHVIGGTVGLAAGFIGGLTSIITQPYKGVVEDGMGGLMKGFAKGIVGTVSKPVVGILDFANGLALAVKEGSRSSNSILRNRIRATRSATNILGLLQPYSVFDANGQALLYQMNKGDLLERYVTRLTLSQTPNNTSSKRKLDKTSSDEYVPDSRSSCVHAMITSQRVIMYQTDYAQDETNYEMIDDYDFSILANVVPIEDERRRPYIQFLLHNQPHRSGKTTTTNDSPQHPLVYRCDFHERAERLARDVQRAREIFEEEKLSYIEPEDEIDDEIVEEQPPTNDREEEILN